MFARVFPVILCTAMLAFVHPVSAQLYIQKSVVHNCSNAELNPDDRIEACSIIIHTNRLHGNMLAVFYSERSRGYESKGDNDNAMQDMNKAIELWPDFYEGLFNRAILFQKEGKLEEAIQDFDRAAQIKPDDPTAHDQACALRAQLGREQECK